MARLGDVCILINGDRGKNYPSKEEMQSEGVPFINAGHLKSNCICFDEMNYISEEKFSKLSSGKIQNGDLLYCLRGSLGKKAIVDGIEKGAVASSLVIIRPATNFLRVSYLSYVLDSPTIQEQMQKANNGSSQPNLSADSVKNFEFQLPSLEKQDAAVSILDKVSNLITLRKKQLGKLDELVKARFVEMFGDPVLNQKHFPVYTVDDVITFQGGSQPDKKFFEYEPANNNIRLIQIRDYKSDKFITYIPQSMAKRFCTADDIMIGRYGPPIFQILQGIEGSFNVALMKATPKMGNREFIRHFLKQDCLLEYLEGLSKRTAGQDGIQMDKLKAYPFPYPPIELQDEFAAFVKQISKQNLTVQRSLDKLEVLKKSLMQQYF